MITKEKATLSTLLARFYGKEQESFVRYFKKPVELPKFEKPFLPSTLSPFSWLQNIHYSWIEAALEDEAKGLFFYFFGEREKRRLKMNQEEVETSPFLLPYLAFLLKKKIVPENILPIEQLSFSELNRLLFFPKEKIVQFIDLLGLNDLAIELRSIVDKKKLEQIFSLFSKEEKDFLEYFSKQRVKWTPPSLKLTEWDGEKETLFRLLHHRGLIRLGKALAEEEENFLWHLSHKLDIGRGEEILKWAKSEEDKELLPYFKGQVVDLIKRFSE